jgi:hypothetical protein
MLKCVAAAISLALYVEQGASDESLVVRADITKFQQAHRK